MVAAPGILTSVSGEPYCSGSFRRNRSSASFDARARALAPVFGMPVFAPHATVQGDLDLAADDAETLARAGHRARRRSPGGAPGASSGPSTRSGRSRRVRPRRPFQRAARALGGAFTGSPRGPSPFPRTCRSPTARCRCEKIARSMAARAGVRGPYDPVRPARRRAVGEGDPDRGSGGRSRRFRWAAGSALRRAPPRNVDRAWFPEVSGRSSRARRPSGTARPAA